MKHMNGLASADSCEGTDLAWEYFAVSKELLLRVRVGENSMTLTLKQTLRSPRSGLGMEWARPYGRSVIKAELSH